MAVLAFDNEIRQAACRQANKARCGFGAALRSTFQSTEFYTLKFVLPLSATGTSSVRKAIPPPDDASTGNGDAGNRNRGRAQRSKEAERRAQLNKTSGSG